MVDIPKEPLSVTNFCGNEFQAGNGQQIDVESPYTGETVAKLNCTSRSDLEKVVAAASQAQKAWGMTPIKERCNVLMRFRASVLGDMDRIANAVSLESGKTVGESKAGILKGIEVTDFAIALQNSDLGGAIEVSRGVTCEYRREPLGVVAGIAPFNFPAMVPMWMYPIAIALGNAFILKPSEKVPVTSQLMAEHFVKAGLPKDIFCIVQGGKETVQGLIEHPDVKALGFVGSTPVALSVYKQATAAGKRCLALGGAKNHLIVVPDADPDITIQGVVDSFTGCAGQRCMAASLMLAVGDVSKHLLQIVDRAKQVKLGETMGAIIDKSSYDRIMAILDRAEKAGANFLLDGRKCEAPKGYENGYWIGPTILEASSSEDEWAKTEIFGPVLTVLKVDSLQKAIELENKNPFGNATSIFTTHGGAADYVARNASNGMIGVNIGVPVPREPFSFGGTKESKFGHGDITGQGGVEFWTDRKKITRKWNLQRDNNWMS